MAPLPIDVDIAVLACARSYSLTFSVFQVCSNTIATRDGDGPGHACSCERSN